jgi:CheY-like chemotaxis protein
MKILIIEDHPDMRELLRLVLKSLDYIPIEARDGKEGVEKAISEKPEFILMDIRMPVMDGWQAVKLLRANLETRNIPILATTALMLPQHLKACLEAGCNGYIVKPFARVELQTKITELLTDMRSLH